MCWALVHVLYMYMYVILNPTATLTLSLYLWWNQCGSSSKCHITSSLLAKARTLSDPTCPVLQFNRATNHLYCRTFLKDFTEATYIQFLYSAYITVYNVIMHFQRAFYKMMTWILIKWLVENAHVHYTWPGIYFAEHVILMMTGHYQMLMTSH